MVLIFILIYFEWRDTENQHDQKLGLVDFWDCYYGQREKWPIADRCFPSNLRSSRLEVVGTRKNGRARRSTRGERSRVSPSRVPVLSFAHYFQAPGSVIGGW